MAMSTSSGSADYRLFDELAEEFAERYRRGERPSLQEYVDRCPAMGDEIRELFPALVEVEQAEEVLEPRREPAASPSALALRQVGDYRVIREVGRGGMGVVYEAEQVSLGRRVALKILPGVVAKDRKALERFRREARAAARLHHTNIVPVFEVGQDGDVVFYAMQFIQGQGLEAVIDELARQRQKSGHGTAAPVAAAGEEQRPCRPGTTQPERIEAVSRSPAALPVRERTEALVASLRAREVSRMARSLVTGTFAAEIIDPDRTGSSSGLTATGAHNSQPSSGTGLSSPASSSTSAVLPGGTQVSAVESSGRRLPFFRSVAQIGRQAAQGLAYAHARGIIHRDIKPSNLLLDSAGVVWIADFGLAKADDDGLTATGDILGTIRYMAPERFRGEGDVRADVYALGLTLYELLTLRPGFGSADRLQMIERIKSEEPVRPRTVDSRIPRDLETIVLKAIDKDPDRRYPTADALAEDLRRYLDDEPVLARRTTAIERYARWARHNPGVAILGGVLTAVLLLATAGSLIVAERMSRLASQQEVAAREAELARRMESNQRALAEQARFQAETSRVEALAQSRAAKANFEQARKAVDDFFIKVSESKLKGVPGLRSLRAELLGSAFGFYSELLRERADDPSLRRDLLQSRFRAGRVLHELGRDAEAGTILQAAAAGYELELRAHPDDVDLKAAFAETTYLSAAIDPVAERKADGLRRAITLREEVLKARPGDRANKLELADVYNALANHCLDRAMGDALSTYERSLILKLELASDSPDDASILLGLSQSFNNLANLFASDKTRGQVLAMYQQAAELTREAIRLQPGDTNLCRKLLVVTTNLSGTLSELYRLDEAIAVWRRSVATLHSMARANPEVPDVHAAHLQASIALADLLLRLNANRADDAVRTLLDAQEALEHLPRETAEDLVSAARQRLAFADRLIAIKPKLSREETLARDDQLDRAVDALRQAVAAGWRGLVEIQGVEPLKTRPAYTSLLAEAERASRISATSPSQGSIADGSRSAWVLADQVHSALDLRRSRAIALGAIGRARFESGKTEQGREALEQSLAIFEATRRERPDDLLALADVSAGQVVIGQVLWDAGKLEEGDKYWRAARWTLGAFPRHAGQRSAATDAVLESWQTMARTYAQHGMYEEAARLFEDAAPVARATLREMEAFDLFDFNAVCLHLRRGDTVAYRRGCAALVERFANSDNPVTRMLLAWATELSPQSVVDPVQRLKWAATAESSLHGGSLMLFAQHVHGLACYRAGRWAEAIAKVRESEDNGPDWAGQPMNWCVQAMAAFRLGKTTEARAWLDRVEASVARLRTLLRDPGDLTVLPSNRTPQWGHWRHPISWHEWISLELLHLEVVELMTGSPPADYAEDRIVRGVVAARLGDSPRAEADLRAAVEEAPNAPSVWLTRSHAFRVLGNTARAEADLDQGLKLPGGAVETWIDEYRWLVERGEHDLARRVLDRVRSIEPKTALGWAERALALVTDRQIGAATQDLVRAAKTSVDFSETHSVDLTVIECLKLPVLERRWADALALIRALNPSSRTGPTSTLEAVLERIEANLILLSGDRAGFPRYLKTIMARARAEREPTLAGELAFACVLAPQTEIDPEVVLRLAEQTIASRPVEEAWWRVPLICGLVRAGRYVSAVRAIDDVVRINPGWNVATNDLLRAIAHHHLGHEAEARHWLAIGTGKMVAPSASGSAWSAWARNYVQDALSHETLYQEAVELILDPAFPVEPFDPG